MATWLDGPEYAPLERPESFTTPDGPAWDAAAVAVAEPDEPAQAPPAERPAFQPAPEAPPLDAYVPPAPEPRDPLAAFDVPEATLTSASAWAAAHTGPAASIPEWSPDMPFQTAAAPFQGYIPQPRAVDPMAQINPDQPLPAWAPPPAARQPQPVTPSRLFKAVTVPVVVALVLGAFVNYLSLVMLLVAFLASTRIAYRLKAVRWTFAAAGGIVVAAAAWSLWDNGSYRYAFQAGADMAQFMCWAVGAVVTVVCYLALSNGEPPSRG
ncbi:MAG: hypothetical protein LBR32_07745 [Propionibacteriaceae bacterium]|nr:hypothetical protein [Propionibacteriaceae bacterium]